MSGLMLLVWCVFLVELGDCAVENRQDVRIPGVHLRLAHGVVFTYRNELINSNDFESFSFMIPKFEIPKQLFARQLPCIYKGRGNDHPLDYHGLIHDVCVQVETLFDQHRHSRDTILLNIEKRLSEAESLLPAKLPANPRFSRAIIGGVSYLTKFLFGIPSEGDFRRLQAQIGSMYGKLKGHDRMLRRMFNGVTLMNNVTNHRLDVIQRQQNISRIRFDSLIENLSVWRENLRRTLHDSKVAAVALTELIGYLNQLSQLTSSEVLILATLEQESNLYFTSIKELTEGRLPEYLVKPATVREALVKIGSRLSGSSGQMVSHTDVSYYYKNRFSLAVHNDEFIVINVKVPIHFGPAKMKLYAVNAYPVPHGNGTNDGFTTVDGLPDYVAFSENDDYMVELDKRQADDCLPLHCHNTVPLIRVDKSSCVMAIFRSDHRTVVANCQINYRGYLPFPTMVTDLTHGHFLVASRQPWTATCHAVPPKEVEACDLCLIALSCGCSLHSEEVTVLPAFSHCNKKSPNTFKVAYPFNSIILHTT